MMRMDIGVGDGDNVGNGVGDRDHVSGAGNGNGMVTAVVNVWKDVSERVRRVSTSACQSMRTRMLSAIRSMNIPIDTVANQESINDQTYPQASAEYPKDEGEDEGRIKMNHLGVKFKV